MNHKKTYKNKFLDTQPPLYGRFAPSPTGPLHLGSLVTALASYIDVKASQGVWWLRIDDLDPYRTKKGAISLIQQQLTDHGLKWDPWPEDKGGVNGILFQSKRHWWYQEAFNKLLLINRVFGCICSRKEIKKLFNEGKTFKLQTGEISYPGTCKKVNFLNYANLLSWRFNSYDNDDFVILRKDKTWSYSFAGVIDDSSQKITHILRGDDLKPILNRNRMIQSTLGYRFPRVMHLPVVTNENGRKLSKHVGSSSIKSGIHVEKQLKFAWQFLEKSMPTSWLERVSSFTHSYFF
ncbi:MAG: hypothetical protein CBD16_02265 [Betaproteobacteria bacterium TMED156]|nr:MAG: hypothetical protein CBD16_02265 [Betaproteobacteria bacterium TMED156]